MTDRLPLVRVGGKNVQIPAGDALGLRGALNEAPRLVVPAFPPGGSYVNVSLYAANSLNISGTASGVQILGLQGGVSGARRVIRNTGSVPITLRYDSGFFVLPGAVDILMQPNDSAEFLFFSSTGAVCLWFQRADGTALAGDPTKLPLAGGKMTGALSEATIVAVTTPASENINAAALAGNTYSVTGSGAISYLNNSSETSGAVRRMIFNTAGITLRHLGGNLRLPGAVAITTQAGDVAEFVQDSSTTWRCISYTRADGTALSSSGGSGDFKKDGSVAMTGAFNEAPIVTADLSTDGNRLRPDRDPANTIQITSSGYGLNSIFTMPSGTRRTVILNNLTITNSTALKLIGGADILARLGDVAEFISLGGGNWVMTDYQRADGTPLVGAPDASKLPLAGGTMTGAINEATVPNTSASGGVVSLGVAASANTILIQTTDPVTGIASLPAGSIRRLTVDRQTTFTNSASFLLFGSANIVLQNNDVATFLSMGSGNWKMVGFARADGTALAGSPDASKVPLTAVGAANGVAPLGSDSKVPSAYLPSYVDDVLEYANLAAFPATGETGKIYIALDTNREYRWSGSTYIQLVASPGTTDNVPEGTTNLYFTAARVLATVLSGLSLITGSPVVATDSILAAIGKLQAQNTAQDTAIAGKEPSITAAASTTYWNGLKSFVDFATSVRAAVLTGLSLATSTPVTATDSVLTAIGKLQAQLTAYGGVFRVESIATTAVGQTSYAVPNGYTVGAIVVSLNGALMDPADFTATNGTTVVLGSGALSTSDVLNVIVIGAVRAQDDALLSYTVATLPAASANTAKVRYCTNMAGGAAPVYSNGTNWLRVADNTVVTT